MLFVSFVSETESNVVNKPKIALEAQLTFLYRNLHSFCSPFAKIKNKPKEVFLVCYWAETYAHL